MCVVYMWYYVLFQYTFTLCNAQISLKHVSVNIFSFFFMMETLTILLVFLKYMVQSQYSHLAVQ